MTYSDDCVALTKDSEGCSLKAYQDAVGVWTIGYGHTGKDVTPTTEWTEAQALEQLAADLKTACDEMQEAVKVELTQGQVDALTDFVFNMGAGNLRTSTLLRKLNNGYYDEIPAELMRWVYAGGRPLPGLIRRRQREVELWNRKESQ